MSTAKTQNLKPYQHIDCNGCRANAHSEAEQNEKIHVVTNCGDKATLGGCFGIVMYPIKNPSTQAHERFCYAIKASNEAVTK